MNLKGTFLMTQVHSLNLIKQLTASGESDRNISGLNGSIVNIASASAKVCTIRGDYDYCQVQELSSCSLLK